MAMTLRLTDEDTAALREMAEREAFHEDVALSRWAGGNSRPGPLGVGTGATAGFSRGGEDAYPSILEKAAALLHSLARNHALVDGSKRLALAATATFLWINGKPMTLTNDEADELVVAVAVGELDDIRAIASQLQ